MYVYVVSTMYV
jgi:DNA-directed RNA polymerase I and III subunit RPAC1